MKIKKLKWYHYITVGSVVASWFANSIKDGIINEKECTTLVIELMQATGFKGIKVK
jgi:hypothetical protein